MKLHLSLSRAALSVLPLSMLIACGDGGTTATPDTTQPVEETTPETVAPEVTEETLEPQPEVVAETSPEVEPDTTTEPETVEGACSRTGFTAATATFQKETGTVLVALYSDDKEPVDVVQIEIYTAGEYTGATGVGTYSLADSNYQTCSNCVVLRTECSGSACDKRFLVDEGDLVISQWDATGGLFKAKLVGAKAHEVTIDPDSFLSTRVTGGETWCLDGLEFEAPIEALPVSDRTQPECVSEGTGNVLHDNIANIRLSDCNGRQVSLHKTCGDPDQKALWLIGTTGWCSVCHEFLTNFVANHGGSVSRKIVGEQTPGLDLLIILGEDSSGAKPTQAYCKAYAADLGIDPGMVLMDWSDTPMPLPIVNEPGMAVETNALGTTWTAIDPYLYSEGGGVSVYYPWWALLRPSNMEYVWSDRAALDTFEATLGALLAE